jgi:hypothetical protein
MSAKAPISKAGSILAFAMMTMACDRSPWWSYNNEEVVLSWPQPPPGWITIEYGRPGCPSLELGPFGRRIVIPSTGYACTSSPVDEGLVRRTFIAIDAGGLRLDVDQKVHNSYALGERISSRVPEGSTTGEAVEEKRCAPSAEVFWYGPTTDMTDDTWAAYKQRHPECP